MLNLIERRINNFHYFVDPSTPSDIFFDNKILQWLTENDCDLSISSLSDYIKEHSPSYMPILLTWDMTSRCNFNCPFCYIRDNSIANEVTFAEAKPVIDELVNNGLFEVYLSGGECTLLDDFVLIYKYLKLKGVFVTVFTNASLINDNILDCWRELPPSSVEITLYNDDLESAPFINIIKLHNMGIYVLPKFTLTKTTLKYFAKVSKWAKNNGFFLAVDTELFDGTDELHSNIAENYSLSVEQKKIYAPDRVNVTKSAVGVRKGFSCKSKKGTIQISPDFSISLCNKMKTRWDLRNCNVITALNELREIIKKYEDAPLYGCKGCAYTAKCSMCYANAEIFNGELHVPKGYCEDLKKRCEMFIHNK